MLGSTWRSIGFNHPTAISIRCLESTLRNELKCLWYLWSMVLLIAVMVSSSMDRKNLLGSYLHAKDTMFGYQIIEGISIAYVTQRLTRNPI